MRVLLFAAVAVLLVATACGGGAGPATNTPAATDAASATTSAASATAAGPCPAGAGLPVAVQDFSFGPQTITVPVGGAVTWLNSGAAAHTVTFSEGPDCGRITAGQSVSRTFDVAGSFAYVCTFHQSTMRGTVVVQ